MINVKREHLYNLSESATGNPQVTKELAAIRGAKVIAFAERAEQNLHIDDSLSQRLETAHTDEDKAAARGELWKHRASSVLERTSDVAIGVWENTKRNLSETGVAQKLRWKLLNHGTTYAFDAQIEHLKVKAAAVEDKKQREARKFDELKARFEAGAIDIERNKAEHLADFDESLKKIEERNQEIQEKKKEHERKVQELKDGVNNRITGRIREVQEKYNLQFNKEKQVELKNCIVTSESQLKTAKERHDELEAQIKVLFGTGIMGWIRKKTGAKSESVLEATVLSDEEMKALSDEEKDAFAKQEKAKTDIKQQMEVDITSHSAVAEKIKSEFTVLEKEIARLEENIALLKGHKYAIDEQVAKADGQIAELEQERKSFGIGFSTESLTDEDPGNRTKVETFKTVEDAENAVRLVFDGKVALFEAKMKSVDTLFTKEDAFNSRLIGFDSAVSDSKVTHSLLKTRESANELSFELEQLLRQIEETAKDNSLDKKQQVELYGLGEKVASKIEEIRENILNPVALDEEGKVKEGVDQRLVLHSLCESTRFTSLKEGELFGDAKTDQERVELLNLSIEQIETLSPSERLKAYTNLLISSYDGNYSSNTFFTEAYNRIADECIPRAVAELEPIDSAVESVFDALEILSDEHRASIALPVIKKLISGIAERIKETDAMDEKVSAFKEFARRYMVLPEDARTVLGPSMGVGAPRVVKELADSIIDTLKKSETESVSDSVKNMVEIGKTLSYVGFDENAVMDYFTTASDFLAEKMSGQDIDTKTEGHDSLSGEPLKVSVESEYMNLQKYIRYEIAVLGYLQGKPESMLGEVTVDGVLQEIIEFAKKGDHKSLASYSIDLARDGHPEEAESALNFARILSRNDINKTREVLDEIKALDANEYEWMYTKALDMLDDSFESLKYKNNVPALMQSFEILDEARDFKYFELVDSIADHVARESFRYGPSVSIETLDRLLNIPKDQDKNGNIEEVCDEIVKHYTAENSAPGGERDMVKLFATLEKNGKSDSAQKVFDAYIQGINFESGLSVIDAFAGESVQGIGEGNTLDDTVVANTYVQKIVNSISPAKIGNNSKSASQPTQTSGKENKERDAESTDTTDSLRVDVAHSIDVFNSLEKNGFAIPSEFFESRLDIGNEESLLEYVDVIQELQEEDENLVPQKLVSLIETNTDSLIERRGKEFDSLVQLMNRWSEKDNNLYIKPLSKLRELTGTDVELKLELAEIMSSNEIGLGLASTLEEAEVLIKRRIEDNNNADETDINHLKKLQEIYSSVNGYEAESQRLETEIEQLLQKPADIGVLDESIDLFGDSSVDSNLTSSRETEKQSGVIRGIPQKQPQPQKKKSFLARFFGSLFGSSENTDNPDDKGTYF